MPGEAPIVKMNEMIVTANRIAKIALKWCWKYFWIQEIMGRMGDARSRAGAGKGEVERRSRRSV
jgi:hypothetical protein